MSEKSGSHRILLAIATGGSAWLSGTLTSLTLHTIPTLASAPSTLAAHQFTILSTLTALTIPPTTLFTSALFFYAAYRHPLGHKPSMLAGSVVFAVLPFTYGVMSSTSRKLLDWAKGDVGGFDVEAQNQEEYVGDLVKRWGALNLGRAWLAFLGAWVGVRMLL